MAKNITHNHRTVTAVDVPKAKRVFKNEDIMRRLVLAINQGHGHMKSMQLVATMYSDNNDFFHGGISPIDSLGNGNSNPLTVDVKLNGHVTKLKLDTGADVTVNPISLYTKPRESKSLKPVTRHLYGHCRYEIKCKGTFYRTII